MVDLAPDVVAILFFVAIAAGFVDAIAGGGGLLSISALLAVGVSPVGAIATNKVQSCMGTASAAWTFWRAGTIDGRLLRAPLVAAFAGSVLGALALMVTDTRWLMVALPVLLIAIAVYFLFGPQTTEVDRQARLSPLAYSGVSGAIGFYDGFFGPGTGSFFAISLVTLMGMGLVRATAHTKLLNLTSNLIASTIYIAAGQVLWVIGGIMALGNLLGGWLGSKAAMHLGPRLIRPLLIVISLVMTARLLMNPDNPLRQLVQGYVQAN